jgi:hypothetical protein
MHPTNIMPLFSRRQLSLHIPPITVVPGTKRTAWQMLRDIIVDRHVMALCRLRFLLQELELNITPIPSKRPLHVLRSRPVHSFGCLPPWLLPNKSSTIRTQRTLNMHFLPRQWRGVDPPGFARQIARPAPDRNVHLEEDLIANLVGSLALRSAIGRST